MPAGHSRPNQNASDQRRELADPQLVATHGNRFGAQGTGGSNRIASHRLRAANGQQTSRPRPVNRAGGSSGPPESRMNRGMPKPSRGDSRSDLSRRRSRVRVRSLPLTSRLHAGRLSAARQPRRRGPMTPPAWHESDGLRTDPSGPQFAAPTCSTCGRGVRAPDAQSACRSRSRPRRRSDSGCRPRCARC